MPPTILHIRRWGAAIQQAAFAVLELMVLRWWNVVSVVVVVVGVQRQVQAAGN